MDNISFWKWERNKENSEIFVFGLQYVTINIKGWLNMYIPYLVYNQIWLNISMDNCDLVYT